MRNKDSLFNEQLFHRGLESGLQLFFMPKKGFEKKYAILATNFGSNDLSYISKEDNERVDFNPGIAHFLEHKMFEQADGSDAFSEFAKYGANANAFTNFNMTAYLFGTTDNFYPSLKHLLSYVYSPYFTDQNVEKEKGIITQEIKMYEDNGDWRLFFNTLKAMYINHPNRIDIAGTPDTIGKITKEELYRCYNTFYAPANMALFVVGDLKWEDVYDTVQQSLITSKSKARGIERVMPIEPNTISQKVIKEKMEVSIPMFSIGYKDAWSDLLSGKKLLDKTIRTEIIYNCIFKKGSALHDKLYEEQLILNPLDCNYSAHNDFGYTIISGESRDIDTVHKLIREEIQRTKQSGIDRNDFERIKKSKLGSFVRIFDSIESIANSFLNYYFEGIHLFDIYGAIKNVTLDEVNQRLREHFNEDMAVISIVEPKESR